MTDRDIKKMNREDLIGTIIYLLKENKRLADENEELEWKIDEIKDNASDSESLASAVLRMSGIFEAADKAAKEYAQAVRKRCESGVNDVSE